MSDNLVRASVTKRATNLSDGHTRAKNTRACAFRVQLPVRYVSHGLCRVSVSPRENESNVDGETRQSHFLRACVVKVASACVRIAQSVDAREKNAGLLFRDRGARNCIEAGDKYF